VRGRRRRRRRCAGPRKYAATPAHRRRARGGARRRRAAPEEEEAGDQEREHGPELRETFAGVNTYSTGDIYTAGNAYTTQNTDATPPTGRPRLHRRPARPLYSLLPLGLLPVMAPQVLRRVAVNFLPGCWPSSRRTAVPRRMGLLGRSCSSAPPSPCEERRGLEVAKC
jgi:hypothetical protein